MGPPGLLIIVFFLGGPARAPHGGRKLSSNLFLFLFVFVAFRFEVGCDWGSYLIHYQAELLGLTDYSNNLEGFYWLFLRTIISLGLPYQAVQIASSVIFFISLYRFSSYFNAPVFILAFAFPLFIFVYC